MRWIIFFSAVIASVAGASGAELPAGSPVAETLSFEGGLPEFVGAEKGRVSIDERHAQEGSRSLRWDWEPGGTLTFRTGPLGSIRVSTGYGGYSRSAFSARVGVETIVEGEALTFRWVAGNRTGATFAFPLIRAGWQHVCYHYSSYPKLANRDPKVLEQTDRVVVEAPRRGTGGTAYFDMVDFNKPVDYRGGREPATKVWAPLDPGTLKSRPELVATPAPEELAAVDTLLAALSAAPARRVGESDVAPLEKKLREEYALHRLDDGLVVGKAPGAGTVAINNDLLALAKLWQEADRPEMKARIEAQYFLLDDYFRELGAVAQGSVGDLSWYGGRTHADACFLMREPLRRTGRLPRVRDCLKYHWNYDALFTLPEARRAMGMDYFRNDVPRLFRIALMHDTPAETVTHLRAFTTRFAIDLVNSIEPDGSLYHHGAHYMAYADGAMVMASGVIRALSQTPFALPRPAYEKLKRAVLNERFYANLADLPMCLHGRHPGRQALQTHLFAILAEAGRAYHGGKLDRELAAAYLRFVPGDAARPDYTAEGITPEPAPQGNVAMNYAGMMGHRRGEWLALVRGYGRYYWAQESYANANRHGLFMGNGTLDILASGSPINLVDSGSDASRGWDWRHFDGTTSFEAPYARIANGNGTMSERSDVAFIGGLSQAGRNGVFVMPLHSALQYARSLPEGVKPVPGRFFAAVKTYFLFDERIVCLGSGISLPDSPYPVRTTLFQKHLKEPATPVRVDGAAISALPYRGTLAPEQAHTLLDFQGTGYYLPAGQSVSVSRERQKSRDGHDEKETEGDYATAWIEHGIQPKQGIYAYVVLPKSTPEALGRFAQAMAGPGGDAPIVVLRRDAAAHVVFDRQSATWGCVFLEAGAVSFGPAAGVSVPPVRSVDRPCLVMAKRTGEGGWLLSVCDPDLNLVDGQSRPRTLTLTLAGAFTAPSLPEGVRLQVDGKQTLLRVECVEGRSCDVALGARGSAPRL